MRAVADLLTHPRPGPRPHTSTSGPQRQLDQQSPPALWGELVAATFAMEGVVEGHRQVSPPSSRAVFLTDHEHEAAPERSLAPGRRLEPVHLHGVDDTSIHLVLPPERGTELTNLGWAQPHAYGDFGTEWLVYGPRDHEELAAILTVIAEALEYGRGRYT